MPQLAVFFFAVERLGLSTLKMPGSLLSLVTDVAEILFVSDGNVGRALTRCVIVLVADTSRRTEMIALLRVR